MSRSITYTVEVMRGNKKEKLCVSGLYNPHNAELFTSHFDGKKERGFMKDILDFERKNRGKVVSRVYRLNASTGSSKDQWLNEIIPASPPAFSVFRETFDHVFERVNSFKG